MGVEAATFISQLNTAFPDGAIDPKSQGDNHLRLIKAVLQATFPYANSAAITFHRSASAPVVFGNGVIWVDTTTATAVVWKYRATSAWITLPFVFNETAGTMTIYAFMTTAVMEDGTAGAGTNPIYELYRNITGADNNLIGEIQYTGKNVAATKKTFVRMYGKIGNAGAGTEQGQILWETMDGGALALNMWLGRGLVIGNATGSDVIDAVNTEKGFYINGQPLGRPHTINTPVAAATSDFTAIFTSTTTIFKGVRFEFENIIFVTDGEQFGLRFNIGAGFITTATYTHGRMGTVGAGTAVNLGSDGDTSIVIAGGVSNGSARGVNGWLDLVYGSAAGAISCSWQIAYSTTTPNNVSITGNGRLPTAGTLTGVRFFGASNITGTIRAYPKSFL